MKILDVKNNALVQDDKDIERKIAGGEYAFQKGAKIPVITPDGQRGEIPSEDAAKAFSQGFKYVTPTMFAQEENQKKYGEGIEAEAAAFGLGAARGVTFGLSDQALSRLKLVKPEALKLYRDLNPTSSLLGEVSGVVVPTLLSGGTSLVGRVAAKTLPGITSKAGIAASNMVAGKIASKTVSKIVQNAAKTAAGSAVEGALYGAGQLISEDALGDADFNAENLLAYTAQGAMLGGALGGGFSVVNDVAGGVVRSAKKGIDKTLLKQMGLTQKQADDVLTKQVDDELLSKFTDEVKKKNYPQIVKAADKLGVTPTQGMISDNKLVQQLESSLSQAPTLAGQNVAKDVDKVFDGLEQATKGIFSTTDSSILSKTNLTKFEAGDSIKANLIADIGEKVGEARTFYQMLDDKFGDAAVSDRVKKLLKTRLNKSDSVRLFKSKDVDNINGMIDSIATVRDAAKVRTYLGKELSAAHRAGDYNRVDILDDAYQTLTRLREKAIIENAGDAKEVIAGLQKANATYSGVFKNFQEVSDTLKLGRVRNIDQLTNALNDIDSEKIAERFFSRKNFAGNQNLKTLFPESFDTARKVKLAEIWEKSQHKGEVSVRKFVTNLKKLEKEEVDLIFGVDKRETLEAIETLVNSIPDRVGPSGTAQALDLFNFFSVATQGRDAIRWMLYKKGEKGINKYLNETLDVFKHVEKANNKTKKLLSESVDSFMRASRANITVAALNSGESRDYQKALEQLTEFETDPDGTLEKMTEKNKFVFDNAPRTSEAMSGKIMQKFQFLKEKAPGTYQGVGYFKSYEPAKSAKSKFMRYYSYANNPHKVLEDMKNGFVNPEGVETLRTLYPRMYSELYNEITSRAGEQKNLSYQQRRGLYKMLSIMGEPSLIPDNLRMLQGTPQPPQEQANNGNLRASGLKDLGQANRFATKLDNKALKS